MKKVVVSSIGLCHTYGMDLDSFSKTLKNKATTSSHLLKLGDEAIELELLKNNDTDKFRRIDRISKISLVSSLSCRNQLDLNLEKYVNDFGVIMSTTYGAVASSRNFINSALKNGAQKASPILFPFSVPNAATGVVTIELGVRGFNTTVSGYNSVGYAFDLLKLNRAKGFFVGGCEELTDEFIKLKKSEELNAKNSVLTSSPKIAEGSAVMFVTSESFAKENKLNCLFEICGYSCTCDHYEKDRIDNFGIASKETIYETCSNVLLKNNLDITDFSLIISLGYSKCQQQQEEYNALLKIFGSNMPKIIYPKSAIGDLFGASGPFNVISGYCYLKDYNILNKYILINNYEIGGNVSCIVIKNADA